MAKPSIGPNEAKRLAIWRATALETQFWKTNWPRSPESLQRMRKHGGHALPTKLAAQYVKAVQGLALSVGTDRG